MRPDLPLHSARTGRGRLPSLALAVCTALVFGLSLHAQDIEPRAYSNAPVGVNFLITGFAFTHGGLAFDPALPVKDPQLRVAGFAIGYARAVDLWGKSARIDVIVPYSRLSGTARLDGQTVRRKVDGFADSRFRLTINLYGAPALTAKEFAEYRQDLVVGVSLLVSAPASQYDRNRVVNLGTNRWSFKPEVGISKAFGRWLLEGAAAVTLFTTNHDFYGGSTRSQDPLYSVQGHAVYGFRRGLWGSIGATYFMGGQTTLDGTRKEDRQENWRVGGTLAIPLSARASIKIYLSDGVSARTGNNFTLAGVALQVRWGGGL
jgi:hypothetical protein